MLKFLSFVAALLSFNPALAQDVLLRSDPSIVASGLWDYVLPRFRLKTRINVIVTTDQDAQLSVLPLGDDSLIEDTQQQTFFLTLSSDSANAIRFSDWLTSEVGRNTISAFQVDGQQAFFPTMQSQEVVEAPLQGDTMVGEQISLRKCGRCHVVGAANRYASIGSTPSFMALRALEDWREKFELFYVLNPHPSFTQIEGVTPPFDPAHPPIIYPIFLTLEEVENIGAYMQSVEPLDLGQPLSLR